MTESHRGLLKVSAMVTTKTDETVVHDCIYSSGMTSSILPNAMETGRERPR